MNIDKHFTRYVPYSGEKTFIIERDKLLDLGFEVETTSANVHYIRNILPEGPAGQLKLIEGSQLTRVNQISVIGVTKDKVLASISEHSVVIVVVIPPEDANKCDNKFRTFPTRIGSQSLREKYTRVPLFPSQSSTLVPDSQPIDDCSEQILREYKNKKRQEQDILKELMRKFKLDSGASTELEKEIAASEQKIRKLEQEYAQKTKGQYTTIPEQDKSMSRINTSSDTSSNSTSIPTPIISILRKTRSNSFNYSKPPLQLRTGSFSRIKLGNSKRASLPRLMDRIDATFTPELIVENEEETYSSPWDSLNILVSHGSCVASFLHFLFEAELDPNPFLFYVISGFFEKQSSSYRVSELRQRCHDVCITFLQPQTPLYVGELDGEKLSNVWRILNLKDDEVSKDVLVDIFSDCRQVLLLTKISTQLSRLRQHISIGLANLYGIQSVSLNLNKEAEQEVMKNCLFNEEQQGTANAYIKDLALTAALNSCLQFSPVNHKRFSDALMDRSPCLLKLDASKPCKQYRVKKKQFIRQGHTFYAQTYPVGIILKCDHCKGLIWSVQGQQDYTCSLCNLILHRWPCVETYNVVCIGSARQNCQSLSSVSTPHRDIKNASDIDSSSLMKNDISDVVNDSKDNPSLCRFPSFASSSIMSHASPPQHYNYAHPYVQVIPATKPPHLYTFVKRSQSDRTSDRAGMLKISSHKGHLKYGHSFKCERTETGEYSHPSSAGPSIGSSNSFSDISDISISSSTTRSVESPESHNTMNIHNSASFSRLHIQTCAPDSNIILLDPHVKFNEEQTPWIQSIPVDHSITLSPIEIQRQEIIHELIYTERTHVKKLKIMLYVFKRPLLNRTIYPVNKVNEVLFPNLEIIVDVHCLLLESLLGRQLQGNGLVSKLGDLLESWFSRDLNDTVVDKCHAVFAASSENADNIFKSWKRSKEQLKQDFINQAENNELCNRLTIQELLAVVWQRMTKYPLLIESLLDAYELECETSTGNVKIQLEDEVRCLKSVLERANRIVDRINRFVRDERNKDILNEYQKKLEPNWETSKLPNNINFRKLSDNNRKLLHHGVLSWRLNKQRIVEVHALLLSDLLVLLEYNEDKDKYSLKWHSSTTFSPIIPFVNIIFRENAVNKASFFLVNFAEQSLAQMYEFHAISKAEKDKWEEAIMQALKSSQNRNEKLKKIEHDREANRLYEKVTKTVRKTKRKFGLPKKSTPIDVSNVASLSTSETIYSTISDLTIPEYEFSSTMDTNSTSMNNINSTTVNDDANPTQQYIYQMSALQSAQSDVGSKNLIESNLNPKSKLSLLKKLKSNNEDIKRLLEGKWTVLEDIIKDHDNTELVYNARDQLISSTIKADLDTLTSPTKIKSLILDVISNNELLRQLFTISPLNSDASLDQKIFNYFIDLIIQEMNDGLIQVFEYTLVKKQNSLLEELTNSNTNENAIANCVTPKLDRTSSTPMNSVSREQQIAGDANKNNTLGRDEKRTFPNWVSSRIKKSNSKRNRMHYLSLPLVSKSYSCQLQDFLTETNGPPSEPASGSLSIQSSDMECRSVSSDVTIMPLTEQYTSEHSLINSDSCVLQPSTGIIKSASCDPLEEAIIFYEKSIISPKCGAELTQSLPVL